MDRLSELARTLTLVLLLVLGATAAWWLATGSSSPMTPLVEVERVLSLGDGQARLYRNPVLSVQQSSLLVSAAAEAPAGVQIAFDLKPTETYRLVVRGRSLQGQTTLRLREGDAEPVYLRAPDGLEDFKVRGVTSLEALFYADDPFSYEIRELSLEECPDCKTDGDLVAEILADVPGLDVALGSDRLHAAELILDWASNVTDMALSHELRNVSNPLVSRNPASDIYYDLLVPDIGAVYCGGMSVFLSKVLQLFDFDAFTMDFGDLDAALTHVTVIVPHRDQGSLRFYIYDPTFNVTFRDPDSGDHLSFRQMVGLARRGSTEAIEIRSYGLEERDFVLLSGDGVSCPTLKRQTSDRLICSWPGYGMHTYLADWTDRFVSSGYESGIPGFFQLMTNRVFDLGFSPRRNVLEAFESVLDELGISLGHPRPA